MPTREEAIETLKQCYDPEIHLDVWTLGLIYELKAEPGKVNMRMTFTTPTCPYGPMLLHEIKQRLNALPDKPEVTIELTFDPPWKPSDELRAMLGV
ncbi:MAG: DUF59 domain-containing protein [Candidatus Diapherotrites archaeon]|nr:DUF59 domain-containing protein [Candidatus Diapherotrites archaeon]